MIYDNVYSLKLVTGDSLITAITGINNEEGYVQLCQPMEMIEVLDEEGNIVGKRLQFWQPEVMDSEMILSNSKIVTINGVGNYFKKWYSLIMYKFVTRTFDTESTTSQNTNIIH